MSGVGRFPEELIQRNQWCLWRVEPDAKGRPTKVPYGPDGRKAASNDPKTWSTYAAACEAFGRQPGAFGGIGYFFAADDGVCGVDLDVSLDENGEQYPWAGEIIDKFQNTYRALSVSGHGLHILCKAVLPGKGRNFNVPKGPVDSSGKRAQIGLSDRGRFFALTGIIYHLSALTVAGHQETIDWLLGFMNRDRWAEPADRKPTADELTDAEILDRATRAKNGAKFARLWAGDWHKEYGSQSEADLALCCLLAFWCGPNPARIEVLFRQSGLARDKWLERADYRGRTIRAAIEQTHEFYISRGNCGRLRARLTNSPPESLAEILVGGRQLPEMTSEVLAALQAANQPPDLFARSGRMVAVVRDERDRHIIAEVTEAGLRGRIARSASFYRLNKIGERVECLPPLDIVRDILALPPATWAFSPLDAVIEAPFLRPNGTICDRPGYDPASFLYYAPAPGLRLPEIPDIPTRDHIDVSLELIESAIGDFPFVDGASKANAIGSMLTPLVRAAIDSPTPLALYDAPQAGTGKSLLAEVVSIIATGRAAEAFSAPTDPEKWRKKITTVLSAGSSVVLIDNVIRRLDSDALCMALTATTYADRVFRTFDRIVLPVKCAWIATGNNIQLGGDMPRRCYSIRLDAKHSKPFRRTGFRHENLRAWVMENRGALIAALLTIARYWFIQGRPKPANVRPLGSYESFCETVGGILEVVGIDGFLGNADAMFDQADAEAAQWEAFLLALSDIFNGEPFRVTDVVEKLPAKDGANTQEMNRLRSALPDFLAEAADRTGGFFQRRLGKCFSDRSGRRFGESQVFVERAGEHPKSKVLLWRVVKVEMPGADS
jgi:hypothetical protein